MRRSGVNYVANYVWFCKVYNIQIITAFEIINILKKLLLRALNFLYSSLNIRYLIKQLSNFFWK